MRHGSLCILGICEHFRNEKDLFEIRKKEEINKFDNTKSITIIHYSITVITVMKTELVTTLKRQATREALN